MDVGTSAPDTPYAAIGGGAAQNFQIAQSAHGFRILSSTLYRDKIRAVVREILCNAIDAHVAAGISHRAVEVVLDDNQFLVRDHGLGIPDDRMIDVFCTYFASTKTADEKQTGGFGLGCKAPFAYSDHFSVTSRHAGIQTAYAIAIGSEQTGGAPSLRKMVAVPTDEQGLTVSVPLENEEDRVAFQRALESVVLEGGMNVLLNGMPMARHDYESDKSRGFTYMRSGSYDKEVKVICGNVVYAVDKDPTLDVLRNEIAHKLSPEGYRVVLIAPPGSIKPKPDREGLSYETITLETLARLLKKASDRIKQDMAVRRKQLLVEAVRAVDRYNLERACDEITFESADKSGSYAAQIENLVRRGFRRRDVSPAKEILSIALNILRHGRRSLKRAKLDLKSQFHHYGYDRINLFIAERDRVIRGKVLRIARSIDAQTKIYSRHSSTSTLKKIYSSQPRKDEVPKSYGLGSCTLELTVARTREEASSRMPGGGFAIVLGREPTIAEIATVEALCVKHGFTYLNKVLETYTPPERSKRAAKVEKPAYLEAKIGDPARSGYYTLPKLAAITEPAAYLSAGAGRTKPNYGRGEERFTITFDANHLYDDVTQNICKIVPNTVVPVTRGQLTQLKKDGVRRYQDILLEKATKRLAKGSQAEIDIAVLTHIGVNDRYWHCQRLSYGNALDIMLRTMHPKVLSFILGLKFDAKSMERWMFWRHFWFLAKQRVGASLLTPEETEDVNKVHAAMSELSKTLAGKSQHPVALAVETTASSTEHNAVLSLLAIHKSTLTYTHNSVFTDDRHPELAIELLKFERKRQSAKAKTEAKLREGDSE